MAYQVIYQVFRKEGMSQEEFGRYWRDVHGPIAAALPLVRGYDNYLVSSAMQAADPVPDGFTILRFDSKEDADAAMASEEMAAAGADAANFTRHFAIFTADHIPVV
jgi:uncharacterized protein (TIGR02118 family)